MEKKLKISSTAYRVLLLLQKLNEKELSADQLNSIFFKDPNIARLFSKDVIIKYVSTLRLAGYDISKPLVSNNNCYQLNNAPVQLSFSVEEIKTIALLGIYAQSLQQNKFSNHYFSFIKKVNRYMSKEQAQELENQFASLQKESNEILGKFEKSSVLIKKLEQYINEKQRVEIKYKLYGDDHEKLTITKLQKIKYDANNINVLYYDLISGQMSSVEINEIINIKQLPSLSEDKQALCPVVFKMQGKLAKVYRLYEGEKFTESNKKMDQVTVTAYSDDVDSLLKRLLRYGEQCEVLYPKQVRNKMIAIINTTMKNY